MKPHGSYLLECISACLIATSSKFVTTFSTSRVRHDKHYNMHLSDCDVVIGYKHSTVKLKTG